MKSLFFSYNLNVDCAYIIRVKGHNRSEELAKECAKSCEEVGMPYEFWDAYDGTEEVIKPPRHHGQFMNMIKVVDHYMTKGEVACALSHISLWAKCVEDDKPLVVLEHDAIMLSAYRNHGIYNSICYLGGNEQVVKNWDVLPIPPHASEGPNHHFICRAHAYSIDPAVAKNMLAHVLKFGLTGPLDIMLRTDIFPIHQMGLFAYDKTYEGTTIGGRATEGRSTTRNDNLQF